MGTSSIIKKCYPCFNDLEKSVINEDSINEESTLNEISLEKFNSLIPDKINNLMSKDEFPNYIQSDLYSIKTVKEDSENKQIEMYYHGEYNNSKKKNGKGKLVLIKDGQKFIYHGIWALK